MAVLYDSAAWTSVSVGYHLVPERHLSKKCVEALMDSELISRCEQDLRRHTYLLSLNETVTSHQKTKNIGSFQTSVVGWEFSSGPCNHINMWK